MSEASRYTVRYLKIALSDIKEIKKYNKRYSKKYQLDLINSLRKRCELLSENPFLFPTYQYNQSFRKMVVGDYLIFYKVSEDARLVSVYRILHGRRDAASALSE
jgi:addiction module RelE/StbE family toxin